MSDNTTKESRWLRMLRMTVFIDKSYDPLLTVRFTPLTLIVGILTLILLLIAGVTVLIAFTGLREYIPGYPTGAERAMIVQNLHRADSLCNEVLLRDKMLTNLRDVLSGDLPEEAWRRDSSAVLTVQSLAYLNRDKSENEESFMASIEKEDRYSVAESGTVHAQTSSELERTFFYTPLKGIVTDKFGERNGHFGVDVVAAEGAPIMSALGGTVVFSEWTLQTGYVIMIQHDAQMLSVYRHCSKLLKRTGDLVQGGEAIALLGGSGELSTGPHLHFELWYRGMALDPENYVSFEN